MTQGLPVDRLINVSYSISSGGAQYANVNSALIIGSSDVIDVSQRIRSYASILGVAGDFGTSAPEYLAAVDFFSASPSPTQLFIGRWAQTATAAILAGASLSTTAQAITAFNAITAGALTVSIDGTPDAVTGLNFSAAANLNAVAAIINAALTGATCVWTGDHFKIETTLTGATATIGFPTAPGSGTNIATLLGLNSAQGARIVPGMAAESAISAVTALDGLSTYAYGYTFATATPPGTSDHLAIAAYVQADAVNPHVYVVTTQDSGVLTSTDTTDVASELMAAGYTRTFVFYSSTDPYAGAEVLGRMATVNWQGSNTAINYMYQSLPGLIAETLTVSQAATLDAKRVNYVANYANGVAILESGVMSGPAYLDEIAGLDALLTQIQTNVFNTLTGAGTKVPQTDAGMNLLATAAVTALETFVGNGFLAPGTWTAAGFGQLATGQFMPTGYYVYTPLVASQASGARTARQSVAFQIAAKAAGAIDTANLALTFNR